MNALVQVSELHRQHAAYISRRQKLWGGTQPVQIELVEAPIVVLPPAKMVKVRGKVPQVNMGRVLAEKEERISKLELDIADLQARVLAQAEQICVLNDIEAGSPPSYRKAAAIVIHEVLQHFPDVTWEDVKGVRREKRLIEPRQLCMVALYEQRKDLSLSTIGRIFHRDHTTVLHAVKKLKGER